MVSPAPSPLHPNAPETGARGVPGFLRPNWVEVSLPALRHNFRTIQEFVAPQARVCAVVKADAYGHGAVECARALEAEGATWFGVTSTEEGMRLRQAGVGGNILLMTGFWRGDEDEVVAHGLTPAVWEWAQVEALENAAARAVGPSIPGAVDGCPIHVKVDTGMARLGMAPADLPGFLAALAKTQHVRLEGVFSHLASAEVLDAPDVEVQIRRFEEVICLVQQSGLRPSLFHLANSAGIVTRAEAWKNMVRPGLSLYGYYLPVTTSSGQPPERRYELPVCPVLTWKTRIVALKDVPAQQPVGYNGAYVTERPARLAILPVGYADGLNRQLSSRGRVIVRNAYAPIVGNISMDVTEVDVTAVAGAQVGDEVVLIGSSGACTVSAWEHAKLACTLPYEILCGIGRRVPRIYVE